jgi:hypothetical protein
LRKRFLFLPAIVALAILASGCVLLLSSIKVGNTFYFAGEIQNAGVDLFGDNVSTQFLNSSNQTIGAQGTVDACKRAWGAGETNYFEAKTTDDDVKKVIGKFKIDGSFGIGEAEAGDYTISNIEINRNGDELTITGTVKNNLNDTVDEVRVCAVVRDENDDIQRVVLDDLSPADLDEDDTGNFAFNGIDVLDDVDDTDTVDIYVDGLLDNDPTTAEEKLNNNVVECPDATNTPGAGATATSTATPGSTATSTPDTGC